MKIKTTRMEDYKETKYLYIIINDIEYRITESIDGKLNILKSEEVLQIFPCVANVIEIK